jgi:hypothetical protein
LERLTCDSPLAPFDVRGGYELQNLVASSPRSLGLEVEHSWRVTDQRGTVARTAAWISSNTATGCETGAA